MNYSAANVVGLVLQIGTLFEVYISDKQIDCNKKTLIISSLMPLFIIL